MMSRTMYEQGFLDCLAFVRHYLRKSKDLEEFSKYIEELELAVTEKRLEKLKSELMLL